jgi:hypothetical protein
MSNVFSLCENCEACFAHQLLTKCPACGSESVYQDIEFDREKLGEREAAATAETKEAMDALSEFNEMDESELL